MNGKTYRIATAVVVVALLLAGGLWYFRTTPVMTVTAKFSKVQGIFAGSDVRILGVQEGTVRQVAPEGATVRVTMTLPRGTKLPAKAEAWIVAPSVISDKHIELGPAYTDGPTLRDGAVVPPERTHAPLTWNELTNSMDTLLRALGPDGANAGSGLTDTLSRAADALRGNGKPLRNAIRNIAQASQILAGGSEDATAVLRTLNKLVRMLTDNRETLESLGASVSEASRLFGRQREAITSTMRDLAGTLGQLSELVRKHGTPLSEDLRKMRELSRSVLGHQRELAETLDTAPLAFQNFSRAVTDDNRLRIRLNISTNLSQSEQGRKLCRKFPIPLCSGAGIVNPIPFPPDVANLLDISGVLGGGR